MEKGARAKDRTQMARALPRLAARRRRKVLDGYFNGKLIEQTLRRINRRRSGSFLL
jgi:hypothetical protein